MDIAKYKSVGVNINTYKKLRKLADDEHRNIGQQISKLVNDEYKKNYGNEPVSGGIGSISQKNTV